MIQTTQNTQPLGKKTQTDDFLRVQDLVYLCISRWKWFVLSILVILTATYFYVKSMPNYYTRSASVLIKDDSSQKGINGDMGVLSDVGIFKTSTSVNNELVAFKSSAIMYEVVKRLNLQTEYSVPGRYHDYIAYNKNGKSGNLPVTVTLFGISDETNASFEINVKADGRVVLSDFEQLGEEIEEKNVSMRLGQICYSPLKDSLAHPVKIMVTPTTLYESGQEYIVKVKRHSLFAAVSKFSSAFSASLYEEETSIVYLSQVDQSPYRAEDILNEIIKVYNENWIKDKNQIAVSTAEFIKDRLKVIEKDLNYVDDDISSFKSQNLLPDVTVASNMYMSNSSKNESDLTKLTNQMAMTRFVRNYLANEGQNNQLLPANSGIDNSNIEKQIAEYNTQLLQRNNLVANSSQDNPLVVDLDRSLAAMRSALVHSVDNQITALNTQLASLQKQESVNNSQLAKNPSQAKYLLSVERQQKVKESLYLFLLQKYEENQLTQAFTPYNTRVLAAPHGSVAPTSPNKKQILLIAFVISLLIPTALVFLIEVNNTKVRGRKDLESVNIPFIGEIPFNYAKGQHKRKWYHFKKQPETKNNIVVREGSRNIINEAFRVVRTNLEFMVNTDEGTNVTIITSFNPGSGKSFLSMNLAASFAIKGKHVLVVDGDMRHGSASQYINSPKPGLSDYLNGRTKNVEEIVYTDQKFKNWDIIPIGTMPPNPTELLFNDRFQTLMAEVRSRYDIVFIDCPPIELVADTQIIEKYADHTVFVVRTGLLERNMIPELETIYNEKKYKNMSLILNGTEGTRGRYSYKYGYKYGYHYGYGYGYHYGSSNNDD